MRLFTSLALVSVGLVTPLCGAASPSAAPDIAYQARQEIARPPTVLAAAVPKRLEDLIPPPPPQPQVAPPRDVWERIQRGFGMPELSGPQVQRQEQWYAAHPELIRAITERARRYLFHVTEEVEKRGMPTELALLPMVESAYNPMALSPAQASGLWQFIPATGKRYALAQSAAYDGRRDVLASTRAALDYLKFLFELHGDWHLALASYNWGEQAVLAAIERNRAKRLPAGYGALALPGETRQYVPRLQALKNILSRPAAYGLELAPVPNAPYFAAVEKTRPMDLRLAAKLAEMPVEEFLALNPAYNGTVMASPREAPIVLPVDKVEAFRRNLEAHRGPLVPREAGQPRSGIRKIDAPLPPGTFRPRRGG